MLQPRRCSPIRGEFSCSVPTHIEVRSLVRQITTLRRACAFVWHLVLPHTHTHTHTHTLTLTHTHTHTSSSHHWGVKTVTVRLLAQKWHGMYAHTLTHTHLRTHAHTHTHSYPHTCARTLTHTNTHIHTHTHTHAEVITVRIFAQERHGVACECVWTCHAHARKCAHPQMYLHAHTMYI